MTPRLRPSIEPAGPGGLEPNIETSARSQNPEDGTPGKETRESLGLIFYTGVHKAYMAQHLTHTMLSLNTLIQRKSDFQVSRWILDSGAFTRARRGIPHLPVREYAEKIRRWSKCGTMDACVSQDMMCEPFILEITGKTVEEHQQISTRNWLSLKDEDPGVYVMPVIQGWTPADYARHTKEMSPHLEEGAWTGLGSVCKRQGKPQAISAVITAIMSVRPDLRLHGFGVKTTALSRADIYQRLHSADSMAWSYQGRRMEPKRNNDIAYCLEWTRNVVQMTKKTAQASLM